MSTPAVLADSHQRRLDWFAQRTGTTTYFPEPMPDGLFLVTRPKGIFKPADLEYALSVRISLDSPYADGEVKTRPDGSWYFDYHQENLDPLQRDKEYTNRGLMTCIRDVVPVGVLRERKVPKSARSEYDVLGLAVPVGWQDGYFFFESLTGPPLPRGDTAAAILTRTAEEAVAEEQAAAPPPADDYDARRRTYRQIVARRGQGAFRRDLLIAYARRCAVTGCSAPDVLEAAHLRPYRGTASNTLTNGLLLRTDIHTLLDLRLLAVDPSTRAVIVSKQLADTEYAKLMGVTLTEPHSATDRPADDALTAVLKAFQEAEEMR